jgi:hypothetical protein
MTRLITAVFAFAYLTPTVFADTVISSSALGKQYTVRISRSALAKSPEWEDDAENPPLSAKSAIKFANEMKDSLVKDSNGYKWTLKSLSLMPGETGKWYWLAEYTAGFHQPSTGIHIPHNLRLAVLMDGTVIKPLVADHPKRR